MDVKLTRLELITDRTISIPRSGTGALVKFLHGTVGVPHPTVVSQALSYLGLSRSPQEVGWIMAFDTSGEGMAIVEVARGSSRGLPLHMPTLLSAVITTGCDRFIFIHNHRNDPTPSDEDIELTERMADAAARVGLYFEDHIIVTNDEDVYLSFRKEGLFIAPEL